MAHTSSFIVSPGYILVYILWLHSERLIKCDMIFKQQTHEPTWAKTSSSSSFRGRQAVYELLSPCWKQTKKNQNSMLDWISFSFCPTALILRREGHHLISPRPPPPATHTSIWNTQQLYSTFKEFKMCHKQAQMEEWLHKPSITHL